MNLNQLPTHSMRVLGACSKEKSLREELEWVLKKVGGDVSYFTHCTAIKGSRQSGRIYSTFALPGSTKLPERLSTKKITKNLLEFGKNGHVVYAPREGHDSNERGWEIRLTQFWSNHENRYIPVALVWANWVQKKK